MVLRKHVRVWMRGFIGTERLSRRHEGKGLVCDSMGRATFSPTVIEFSSAPDWKSTPNFRRVVSSSFSLTPTMDRPSMTTSSSDVVDLYGDRTAGALVIVRPDQFVAEVLPLAFR